MGSQSQSHSSQKSKSYRKDCANPLFESWLLEWKDEATAKNSKMQYVYAKAVNSLRKYPLPLKSGRECKILEYFGDVICRMIDSRMSKEGLTNATLSQTMIGSSSQKSVSDLIDLGLDDPPSQPKGKKKGGKGKKQTKTSQQLDPLDEVEEMDIDSQGGVSSSSQSGSQGKRKGSKNYIPAYRSGPYALLITLLKKESTQAYRGYMLKSELQQEAQDYCDSSFKRPDKAGSNYTAWNSMSTLVNKGLVLRQGTPVKFTLTMDGRKLALKLLNADSQSGDNGSRDDLDSIPEEDEDTHSQNSNINHDRAILHPGQFEIVLCVDTGETSAKCKKEEVIGELRKNGVNLEVTRLSVGDFLWVCREVEKPTGHDRRRLTISRRNDMILPYIVERKRTDDLAHSIRDGRFHEQKYRLERTELKPIYLIESYGVGDHGLADGALNQAIANTQIINGFLIQETGSIKETCAYLTQMTRHLSNKYQKLTISSCTKEEWSTLKDSVTETYLMRFYDFNEFGTKARNWTAGEMFAKQLLKIRGLSVEKAYAICQVYPTLHSLFRAYRHCDTDKEREGLVARLYFGNNGRTIGPAISKILYRLYNSNTLI